MAARVLVTHGTMGSPDGNWFPWLARELAAKGTKVLIPQYPGPEGQNLENWLKTQHDYVGALSEGDILVGHSIGAAFTLRLLEHSEITVKAAILVSGFSHQLGLADFDPLNATFIEAPFDWVQIRKHAKTFVSFSGSDDPYVPLEYGRELASNLGIEARVIEHGGHLNAESGYSQFPELLMEICRLLDS